MTDLLESRASSSTRTQEFAATSTVDERGALTLKERVVTTIAEVAARSVPGVVRSKHGLGRSHPSAVAAVAGKKAKLTLKVTSDWSRPALDVARGVQDAAAKDVEHLAGLEVTSVEVELHSTASTGGLDLAADEALPRETLAPEPSGNARVATLGVILALVLAGAGALLLQDGVSAFSSSSSSSWLLSAAESVADLGRPTWLVAVGAAAFLLGVLVLVTSLRRRSRKTLELSTAPGVHLGLSDLARLASNAASECDGVGSVDVRASRRVLTAAVRPLEGADVGTEVRRVLEPLASLVAQSPRVKVKAPTARTPRTEDER